MRPLAFAVLAVLAATLAAGLTVNPLWLYVTFAGAMLMMHLFGQGSHGHEGSKGRHSGHSLTPANLAGLGQTVVGREGLGMSFSPLSISGEALVELGVSVEDNAGDAGRELLRSAHLTDSNGVRYLPLAWSALPSGRRGMEGVLSFPSLEGNPSSIRLVLSGFRGTDMTVEWSLRLNGMHLAGSSERDGQPSGLAGK